MSTLTLKQLAQGAEQMPWDQSPTDVPFELRHAFRQTITANYYLELLGALEEILGQVESFIGQHGEADFETARAIAAIAEAHRPR